MSCNPGRPVVGQEVRQVEHRRLDPPAAVFFERVARGEDEGIEFAEPAGDGVGLPPELRRSAPFEHAPEAVGLVTGFPVVFPEQVHRADQPVLVRCHDPDGFPAHLQDTRAADERDVVEVDHVDVDGVEGGAQRVGLEEGSSRDLGGERRQDPERTLQRVDVQARGRVVRSQRVLAADRVEGVDAVEDVDLVPSAA